MNTKYDKMEIDSLRDLRDFHQAEVNRFQGLMNSRLTEIKAKAVIRTDKYNAARKGTYLNDCNAVYSILKIEKREIGTGELCTFLNERMEYTRKYDSMTFMTLLGKHLLTDKRFYTSVGKVKGKRTTMWGVMPE